MHNAMDAEEIRKDWFCPTIGDGVVIGYMS